MSRKQNGELQAFYAHVYPDEAEDHIAEVERSLKSDAVWSGGRTAEAALPNDGAQADVTLRCAPPPQSLR